MAAPPTSDADGGVSWQSAQATAPAIPPPIRPTRAPMPAPLPADPRFTHSVSIVAAATRNGSGFAGRTCPAIRTGCGSSISTSSVGAALEQSALIPSGDVWDLKADPLAVRETVEGSLSLRDLVRSCTAGGHPNKGCREQSCDERGAHGFAFWGVSPQGEVPPRQRIPLQLCSSSLDRGAVCREVACNTRDQLSGVIVHAVGSGSILISQRIGAHDDQESAGYKPTEQSGRLATLKLPGAHPRDIRQGNRNTRLR